MALEKFAETPNQGITTLDGALSDSATTIPVDSMADLKLTGLTGTDFAYCKITKIGNWRQHPINRKESFEIVKVTAVSGNDLTAVRGADGTNGTAFTGGDIVEVVFVSIHYQHLVDALTDGTKELSIGTLTVEDNVTSTAGKFIASGNSGGFQATSITSMSAFGRSVIAGIPVAIQATDDRITGVLRVIQGSTGDVAIGYVFSLPGAVDWIQGADQSEDKYKLAASLSLTTNTVWEADGSTLEFGILNDLRMLGDSFWVGAGSGLPYGSMYMFQGSETVTISGANFWEELTAGLTAGARLNLMTFQNSHELAVDKAGEYDISWSASVQTASAQQEVMGGVTIDSVDANTAVGSSSTCIKATANHGTIVAANKSIPLAGGTTCELTAGQVLSLCFLNESGAANIIVEHVNFKATMVGG